MSGFDDEDNIDDLVEVPDDESLGIGDMDADDNEEEFSLAENDMQGESPDDRFDYINQDIQDNSYAVFDRHSDSVYCAAIHPTRIPRLILTGTNYLFKLQSIVIRNSSLTNGK